MGILRRLREWREDKNGTLIGPNIDADSVNTDTSTVNESLKYPSEKQPRSETSNRSTGTWYQNTTGQALWISVTANTTAGAIDLIMDVNETQSNRVVSRFSDDSANDHFGTVQYLVGDGAYYKVRSLGSESVVGWFESKIGEGA